MKVKEVNDVEVKSHKKKKAKKVKKVQPPKYKSKLQWPRWKSPFQPGSNLHAFSKAMTAKDGMSIKAFKRLVTKTGAKATWILKCMRKGSAGGWSWEFDDSGDRYCITEVKLNKKGA